MLLDNTYSESFMYIIYLIYVCFYFYQIDHVIISKIRFFHDKAIAHGLHGWITCTLHYITLHRFFKAFCVSQLTSIHIFLPKKMKKNVQLQNLF